MAKRTAWYPSAIKPKRKGAYQVRNDFIRCNCCCMDAYWDGRRFVRFSTVAGILYCYEEIRVTEWRGLVARTEPEGGNE